MFDFIYHRGPLVIHVPLGQTAYRAVETTAIPEDRDALFSMVLFSSSSMMNNRALLSQRSLSNIESLFHIYECKVQRTLLFDIMS